MARSSAETSDHSGVYVCVDELVRLEHRARDLSFAQRRQVKQPLAGRMPSGLRGRGLTFEELRDYLPGDDIRTIDWRVTARTGKPFVRVYGEEKERPAVILVDQRINMFFGSRRSMKSVAAAEAAALCAWRILGSGDRIGGLVFNDTSVDEIRPHRSREAVISLAERVVAQNLQLTANSSVAPSPGQLDRALSIVANIARHDHLIVVISDFDGHGDTTRDLLLRLSARNDVVCVLVYDPFLLDLPLTGEMVVSGASLQAEIAFRHSSTRARIGDYARQRGRELLAWQRELGLPMLPISAAEETAPQMVHLLQQAAWRQRRR